MKTLRNLLGMIVLAVAAGAGCSHTAAAPEGQPTPAVQPTPEVAAYCAEINTKTDKIEKIFNESLARVERMPVEAQRKVAHELVEKALADTRTVRHDACSAANLDAAKAAVGTDLSILDADSKAMFEYNQYLQRQPEAQVSQEQDVDNRHPSPALQSARNVEARRLRQSSFGVTSTDITYGTLWLNVNGLETEHDYNHFICKSKLNQRLWSKVRFNFTTDHAMDIPLPVPCQ
jgi:hypothetical protein